MTAKETRESAPRKSFEELARELGVDEDERHFEDTVRKIAKVPPQKPDAD